MSDINTELDQTVKQMWESFLHQATRNRPGRKVSIEVRAAYYAGCHNMLAKLLATLRAGEAKPGDWAAAWQKLSDELAQFASDYRDGKI
jgi:hypothetical protein